MEGEWVPVCGALVQLVRGGLIVHGLVAWSAEGRCGLKFSGAVDVRQWRASPGNAEQQRVDNVVRLVKAGAIPLPVPPATEPGPGADSPERVSDDLRSVSGLLEKLGEGLAGDADVVSRHGPQLQSLDIAMQMIAAVSVIIDGRGDIDDEITKLRALRRSATQALHRTTE